jgi:hypothetical protein
MRRGATFDRLIAGEAVLKTSSELSRFGAFWTWRDTGHLAAGGVCRRLERLGLLESADALFPGAGGQTYFYEPAAAAEIRAARAKAAERNRELERELVADFIEYLRP